MVKVNIFLHYFTLQDKRIMRSHGQNLKEQQAKIHRRYLPWPGSIHHRDSSDIYGSLLDVGMYRGHVDGETFLAFK